MTTYAIIIERAGEGGYCAWCPDLPGCVALGDTETETIAEMRAIELHIAGMLEDGSRFRTRAPCPPPLSPPTRPDCP